MEQHINIAEFDVDDSGAQAHVVELEAEGDAGDVAMLGSAVLGIVGADGAIRSQPGRA